MNIIARKTDQSLTVRFPDGLLKQIGDAARKQGRSKNTEIIKRLADSFTEKKPEKS